MFQAHVKIVWWENMAIGGPSLMLHPRDAALGIVGFGSSKFIAAMGRLPAPRRSPLELAAFPTLKSIGCDLTKDWQSFTCKDGWIGHVISTILNLPIRFLEARELTFWARVSSGRDFTACDQRRDFRPRRRRAASPICQRR